MPPASHSTLLASVERPARYAGGEFGSVHRKDRTRLAGTCCLVFPDVYEVGMSHLGLRILVADVNAEPDLLAERAFAPWPDMAAALRAAAEPLWSLESGVPVRDFDVVGLTLPHELAAATILGVLELARIPLRAADRRDDDPLVLGGGTWATHAVAVEPFFDALLLGDGEAALPGIVREVGEARRRGVSRRDILEHLGTRPEILVPSLRGTDRPGARALRRYVPVLPDSRPFASGPVAGLAPVFDRITVEIARGCGAGCRFCQAGYHYRPGRFRTVDALVAEVAASLRHTGYDEISLTSLSSADYPCLGELLDRLAPFCVGRKVALSVSSLRAYGIPEAALRVLGHTRRTGLTLAPEAGTQRLRDVISKRVTETDLLDGVRRISAEGWRRVKLYFMLGLPTETDEDLEGLVDLVHRVVGAGRSAGSSSFQAAVSISTFVPKPHTPFQWEPMLPPDEIRRRQRFLRVRLRSRAVEVSVHDANGSVLEALLGRGDDRTALAVAKAHAAGAYLDSWSEHFDWNRWVAALAGAGIAPDDVARPLDPSAPTPWDHVSCGLDPDFLRRERDHALSARPGATCDPSPDHFRCQACGLGCEPPGPNRGLQPAAASPELPRPEGRGSVVSGGAPDPNRGLQPAAAPPPTADRRPPSPWFRLLLRKHGPAVWLGHLDFVRVLVHAMRRARLAVSYTQGFHPGPRLVPGAPLPLGVIGLCEPFDVRLDESPPDQEQLAARLTERIHAGVDFLDVRDLGEANPHLGRAVALADYALAVPGLDEASARKAVQAAQSAATWPLVDPRRERWHGRDAKPATRELEAVDLAPLLSALVESPIAWGLHVRVPLQGCPPPAALGSFLLGVPQEHLVLARLALLDANGGPVGLPGPPPS
ncbi:MAG: TIGR03960 family B12-binding radical SAM protein [Deltaproteobacteria bacterium]|nr:TIGR03960 family B12-binding radical SAM protein [Deltaproteobacteria bacterium]